MSKIIVRFVSQRPGYTLLSDKNHLLSLDETQMCNILIAAYSPRRLRVMQEGIIQQIQLENSIQDSENFYDQNGNAVFAVMYYEDNKFLAWEKVEDALIRRSVFQNFSVLSYSTGYIAGTIHPMMQSGHSANKEEGYKLWQNVTYQQAPGKTANLQLESLPRSLQP